MIRKEPPLFRCPRYTVNDDNHQQEQGHDGRPSVPHVGRGRSGVSSTGQLPQGRGQSCNVNGQVLLDALNSDFKVIRVIHYVTDLFTGAYSGHTALV